MRLTDPLKWAVKCDICDEEFANSEELSAHKEREHPAGDRDDPEPVEQPGR